MRIAYLGDKRIDINEYNEDMSGKLTCAEGHIVIAKRGDIRTHHFSHKNNCHCSSSEGMTDWHINWQNRAGKDGREIRLKADGKMHIADTLIPISSLSQSPWLHTINKCKGFVIEYQHSPMNESVMRERESFYTAQGYHLVWVFDTKGWDYNMVRKSVSSTIPTLNTSNIGSITIRKRKGADFPLKGAYTGRVSKILDFGKKELLIVTKQNNMTITGDMISMELFNKIFLGDMAVPDTDDRPFHHSL